MTKEHSTLVIATGDDVCLQLIQVNIQKNINSTI